MNLINFECLKTFKWTFGRRESSMKPTHFRYDINSNMHYVNILRNNTTF